MVAGGRKRKGVSTIVEDFLKEYKPEVSMDAIKDFLYTAAEAYGITEEDFDKVCEEVAEKLCRRGFVVRY